VLSTASSSAADNFVARVADKVADKVVATTRVERAEEAERLLRESSLIERTIASCKSADEVAKVCEFVRRDDLFLCDVCRAHVNCDQANRIPGKLLKGSPVNTYCAP